VAPIRRKVVKFGTIRFAPTPGVAYIPVGP
jgi:hypothetical protein